MSPRLLGLVVSITFVPAAMAADIEWSGSYIGLFAGYADANDAWGSDPGMPALSPEGAMFGGLAGYTHNIDGLVFGVEADLVFPDFSDTGACSASAFDCEIDVQVLSSLRGRGGVAIGPVQVYGTAGLAMGFTQADSTAGTGDSKVLAGWTAGAGIEWQSSGGLRLGLEHRHSDYGESDVTFGSTDQGEINLETDDVRLRLSIPLN
jgi:outer membrane immunogenic protein